MKRFFSILLIICMLSVMIPQMTFAAEENVNVLVNGDFTNIAANGFPAPWDPYGAFSEVDYSIVSDGAQGNVVKFDTPSAVSLCQIVDCIVGGTEYAFSCDLKAESFATANSCARIRIDWKNESGANTGSTVKESWTKITTGYEKWTFNVTAPADAISATICIRLINGGGVVYFDNVSLLGQKREIVNITPEDEQMVSGYKNLFSNYDMSKWDTNAPKYWTKDPSATALTLSQVEGRSANSFALKMTNVGTNTPYVYQSVSVEPGAEYQIGAWVKIEGAQEGIEVKIQFYDSKQTGANVLKATKADDWTPLANTFRVPQGATSANVLLRQRKSGTVYYTDVQLCKVSDAKPVFVETDEVFYYTDHKDEGSASIKLNKAVYQDLANVTEAYVSIKKGDSIVCAEKAVSLVNGVGTYKYDVSLLTEEKAEYKVYVRAGSRSGESLIYKYPRPEYIGSDKIYRDKNANIILPTFVYRTPDLTNQTEVAKLKSAGINVVQLALPTDLNGDKLLTYAKNNLNYAKNAGLKCIIALYRFGKPAGDSMNIETTKYLVENLAEHDAVFAWAVQDETFNNVICPQDVLRESYVAIRNLDPYHPIYLCEATTRLEEAGRYADILCVDPYPSNHSYAESFPAERVTLAVNAVNGRKPVYSLLQAFQYNSTPSGDQMRNMIYQSFMSGASGIGFYQYRNSIGTSTLSNTHWWPVLTNFASRELSNSFGAFVTGDYPVYSQEDTANYEMVSYVKDNVLYMVVRNKTTAVQNVEIDISSLGESTASCYAGSYTDEAYTTSTENTVKPYIENGKLKITLPPSSTPVFKIVPSDTSEFEGLGIAWQDVSTMLSDAIGKTCTFQKTGIVTRTEFLDELSKKLAEFEPFSSENTYFENSGKIIECAKIDIALELRRAIALSSEPVSSVNVTEKQAENVISVIREWKTDYVKKLEEKQNLQLAVLNADIREKIYSALKGSAEYDGEYVDNIWRYNNDGIVMFCNFANQQALVQMPSAALSAKLYALGYRITDAVLSGGMLMATLPVNGMCLFEVSDSRVFGFYNGQTNVAYGEWFDTEAVLDGAENETVYIAAYKEVSGIKTLVSIKILENKGNITLPSLEEGISETVIYRWNNSLQPKEEPACYKRPLINLVKDGGFAEGFTLWTPSSNLGTSPKITASGVQLSAYGGAGSHSSVTQKIKGLDESATYRVIANVAIQQGGSPRIKIDGGASVNMELKEGINSFTFTLTGTDISLMLRSMGGTVFFKNVQIYHVTE